MEKQQSFRIAALDKLLSFGEKKHTDSPGKHGDTPLHLAARAGNSFLVGKILSDYKDGCPKDLVVRQNQDGETALYVASENGHVEVVREILKVSYIQSAAIKANNSLDALHIAAKQGYVGVIGELLRSFPMLAMTTNSSNSTALDAAAAQGHIDVVNLLLETDASLAKIARSNGKTVLHSAARMGHVKVARTLLSKETSLGSRTDKKGQAAIHMAVKGHNVEMILELLEPDPLVVNLVDNKGNTPVHIATRKGHPEILRALLSVEGINVNAINRLGEAALNIAEKNSNEEIADILKQAGAVAVKFPINPAKQLKQAVSDIKHDVQSQLQHTRQTGIRVQKIKKRLQKLHTEGLNNAINSNTVVAVLIATVAFAAIFMVPGQYVESPTDGYTPGEAYIANNFAFIVFMVFDSLALFISLAVVVVQTSLIVVEQRAKRLMVFVMNKLMWIACLFVSVAFISLTYVVVGRKDWWLAWCTLAIGATIMLTTMGSMCYCIIGHQIEAKSLRNIRKASKSRSRSFCLSVAPESEIQDTEYKKMYAL